MKNKDKLKAIIYFISAILFFIAAFITEDYIYITFACCGVIFGSKNHKNKNHSTTDKYH